MISVLHNSVRGKSLANEYNHDTIGIIISALSSLLLFPHRNDCYWQVWSYWMWDIYKWTDIQDTRVRHRAIFFYNDHYLSRVLGELVIHQLLVLVAMYSRMWAGLLPQEMVTSWWDSFQRTVATTACIIFAIGCNFFYSRLQFLPSSVK